MAEITGILLAAGAGQRFGGDKLLASLAGEPLIAHSARALAPCDRVIAIVRDDGSLPLDGAWPTLIEWGAGVTPPGQTLPPSGVTLTAWEVHTPDPAALANLPLDDPRVSVHPGPTRFVARFDTPAGPAVLG